MNECEIKVFSRIDPESSQSDAFGRSYSGSKCLKFLSINSPLEDKDF
jgi:hypothetical protein